MNASKENATQALDHLIKLSDSLEAEFRTQKARHIIFLEEFIEAAKRKLPTEAAFNRDRKRAKV